MVAQAVNESLAGAGHGARAFAGLLREQRPRRSVGNGNGHPVPRPPRAPTAELADGPPPASPFTTAVVLGAAGAGTQKALGVLTGRVASFTRVVLTADEDVRISAEQLPAYVREVGAGNRPTLLVAVPPQRSIASDPAGEFPLVLPHRVSREPDAEPPLGGQADCRQVLTLIIRQPLRGPEVIGPLPPVAPEFFAPACNPPATSRSGPPLDRHKCGELAGCVAGKSAYRPVMSDHAAVLVDLDGVTALQTRTVEPSAAHKHPPVVLMSPVSAAVPCRSRPAPLSSFRFDGHHRCGGQAASAVSYSTGLR